MACTGHLQRHMWTVSRIYKGASAASAVSSAKANPCPCHSCHITPSPVDTRRLCTAKHRETFVQRHTHSVPLQHRSIRPCQGGTRRLGRTRRSRGGRGSYIVLLVDNVPVEGRHEDGRIRGFIKARSCQAILSHAAGGTGSAGAARRLPRATVTVGRGGGAGRGASPERLRAQAACVVQLERLVRTCFGPARPQAVGPGGTPPP